MDELKAIVIVERLRHIIISYNCGLMRCLSEEDARTIFEAKKLIEKFSGEKEVSSG